MRTVFCRILKLPKVGDELRLCYTASRGGRTEISHVTKEGEEVSLESLAAGFAHSINTQWSSELFSCKSRRDEIVITCSQDDITFYPMLNGTTEAGKDFMEIDN